ncbi:polyribonucleotide nucleotidyltransferase 2, mitochondrial-like isoform X3 [Tripterygium wilfordii]|uniref:polyribonucleotide nucleotidyltransferase 2, mitochondrial-like isoform X3 n=1 Tax=Tripterygium wilfordii TaxID=458696 RepID=UPI0018F7EE95|nr:polyribonucleotide nucleotidyltransferase 2, mitochondrial-like isoform X3 [Tripterygium wilfordii]
MSFIVTRIKNPLLNSLPHFLTWRALRFRTICSGRLGFEPSSSDSESSLSAGTKLLETYKEEFEIGSHLITLETGKIARFANGSVILGMEETKVLSTVAAGRGDAVRDFLPLTVDYQEKQFAQGVIPTTFMRREGAPKERELLCGRLIDRPIRPLFPPGFYHEVQVMASVLSSDGQQDPDVMAANATSAALMLSDIPWGGPIGMIRIGRICGKFIVNPTMDEFERGEALDKIAQDVKKVLEEECDEDSLNVLPKAVDTVRKKVVRKRILVEEIRLDGRRLDEVRPLYCEAGNLPILHGSSLFSRGDTQVLCTVTLGAPRDAQRLDSLVGPPTKRFMLHYSFPPFCIDEVGKRGGLNRREVGHGTLAEKALLAVLPPEDSFPYTVRVNSEVMASDGSTSMATVCGGSMALMEAGIPLREHVAGVSVGLISELDPSTGEIKDYRILTDILGLEDHLGDMDFKIAGTRNGITAIQLDIKPAGIPLDIICESLEPARKGRLQILEHMEREINAPRTDVNRNSPRLASFKYSNDALRRLIGPLGALKRKIEEETGARMSVSDGTLTIVAKNQSVMEKVQEKVDFIIGCEIEIGGIYKGVVTSVKEYGAFIEFNGGQQGLLHVSELSHEPVSRISDVVSVGQQLSLMCIGQDVRGNIKLSLKAALPRPGSESNNVVEGNAPTDKEAPNVWASVDNISASVDNISDGGEEHKSMLKGIPKGKHELSETASTSTPTILIRSAAECDEEEKCAGLSRSSKMTPKPYDASKRNHKPKKSPTEGSVLDSVSSISDLFPSTIKKKSKFSQNKASANSNDKEAEEEIPVTVRKLKIGTKVNAKVYEIRERGLVLDLGGGILAMYRFEKNGKNHFEVGDELRVQCSSFSTSGVPVVSSVNDE